MFGHSGLSLVVDCLLPPEGGGTKEDAMQQTIEPNSPEAAIVDAVERAGDENAFWNFTAEFADTVGFNMDGEDRAAVARLVAQCADQFVYIRENHPDHYRKLCAPAAERPSIVARVAAIVVASETRPRHFAGRAPGFFAEACAETVAANRAAIAEPNETDYDAEAPAAVREEIASSLCDQAEQAYQSAVGRIVKVSEFQATDGTYHQGTRSNGATAECYELVLVDETDDAEIGIVANDDGEGFMIVRSNWMAVVMSGRLRGERVSLTGPCFYEAGPPDGCDVLGVGTRAGFVPESLEPEDIRELALLDALDLAGTEVEVSEAVAYVGDTDDQENLSFDPPLRAVVEPSGGDFDSRIAWDHNGGVDIVEAYVDLSSEDDRLSGYRSAWCYGAAYDTTGRVQKGGTSLSRVFEASRIYRMETAVEPSDGSAPARAP